MPDYWVQTPRSHSCRHESGIEACECFWAIPINYGILFTLHSFSIKFALDTQTQYKMHIFIYMHTCLRKKNMLIYSQTGRKTRGYVVNVNSFKTERIYIVNNTDGINLLGFYCNLHRVWSPYRGQAQSTHFIGEPLSGSIEHSCLS